MDVGTGDILHEEMVGWLGVLSGRVFLYLSSLSGDAVSGLSVRRQGWC